MFQQQYNVFQFKIVVGTGWDIQSILHLYLATNYINFCQYGNFNIYLKDTRIEFGIS